MKVLFSDENGVELGFTLPTDVSTSALGITPSGHLAIAGYGHEYAVGGYTYPGSGKLYVSTASLFDAGLSVGRYTAIPYLLSSSDGLLAGEPEDIIILQKLAPALER